MHDTALAAPRALGLAPPIHRCSQAHAIVKRFRRKLDDPRLARVRREQGQREEPHVAGKKRPKSVAQTEKKLSAKPKRPKKTSRGK